MTSEKVREYLARPYSKILVRDETGGYVAHVLEFPGCLAEGETPDEAVRELDEAMEDWIEEVIESGKPVPEPLEAQGFSGRLVLRLPKSIHRQAAQRAYADGTSLNQWIVEAIGERLGAESFARKLEERLFGATMSTLVGPALTASLIGAVSRSPTGGLVIRGALTGSTPTSDVRKLPEHPTSSGEAEPRQVVTD